MMFYMNSKVFQDVFLNSERDKDILHAQYVLVSTRIRKRESKENIIIAKVLYPDSVVCCASTDEDFAERYYNQLEENKTLIATLILGSINENYNIIFLCAKCEDKNMKFLKLLSNYVYYEFGYPIYDYKLYQCGASELIKYNKDKIVKKCNKLLQVAKDNQYEKDLKTQQGRKRIIKELKKKSKKELKKDLKKRNLYIDGMSKKDMIDTIEDFL